MNKSKEVGNNIKAMRADRGMTQRELAEKLGVTPQGISSWEVGRTEPSINDIERLAAIFGCQKSVILGGYADMMQIERYLEDAHTRDLVLYMCNRMPEESGRRAAYIAGIRAAIAAMAEVEA